jgi:hypothetical protein
VIDDYMGNIFAGELFVDHENDEVEALELVKATIPLTS